MLVFLNQLCGNYSDFTGIQGDDKMQLKYPICFPFLHDSVSLFDKGYYNISTQFSSPSCSQKLPVALYALIKVANGLNYFLSRL